MKFLLKSLGIATLVWLVIVPSYSEPLILQSAKNVYGEKSGEIGIDVNYSYDEWTEPVTNTAFSRKEAIIGLQSKYGISDDFELSLFVPYLSWKQKGFTDTENNGLGVIIVAEKYNFYNTENSTWTNAFGINLELPTGDPKKELGRGLNIDITAASGMKLWVFDINVNVGYKVTFQYTNKNFVVIDTGDILEYGLAIEYPMNDRITFIGEAIGNTFGDYTADGNAVAGTGGTSIDVVPGLRVNLKNMKLKAGVAFSVGGIASRPYMWRLVLGQSFLF